MLPASAYMLFSMPQLDDAFLMLPAATPYAAMMRNEERVYMRSDKRRAATWR